jgi:hypothetical protein
VHTISGASATHQAASKGEETKGDHLSFAHIAKSIALHSESANGSDKHDSIMVEAPEHHISDTTGLFRASALSDKLSTDSKHHSMAHVSKSIEKHLEEATGLAIHESLQIDSPVHTISGSSTSFQAQELYKTTDVDPKHFVPQIATAAGLHAAEQHGLASHDKISLRSQGLDLDYSVEYLLGEGDRKSKCAGDRRIKGDNAGDASYRRIKGDNAGDASSLATKNKVFETAVSQDVDNAEEAHDRNKASGEEAQGEATLSASADTTSYSFFNMPFTVLSAVGAVGGEAASATYEAGASVGDTFLSAFGLASTSEPSVDTAPVPTTKPMHGQAAEAKGSSGLDEAPSTLTSLWPQFDDSTELSSARAVYDDSYDEGVDFEESMSPKPSMKTVVSLSLGYEKKFCVDALGAEQDDFGYFGKEVQDNITGVSITPRNVDGNSVEYTDAYPDEQIAADMVSMTQEHTTMAALHRQRHLSGRFTPMSDCHTPRSALHDDFLQPPQHPDVYPDASAKDLSDFHCRNPSVGGPAFVEMLAESTGSYDMNGAAVNAPDSPRYMLNGNNDIVVFRDLDSEFGSQVPEISEADLDIYTSSKGVTDTDQAPGVMHMNFVPPNRLDDLENEFDMIFHCFLDFDLLSSRNANRVVSLNWMKTRLEKLKKYNEDVNSGRVAVTQNMVEEMEEKFERYIGESRSRLEWEYHAHRTAVLDMIHAMDLKGIDVPVAAVAFPFKKLVSERTMIEYRVFFVCTETLKLVPCGRYGKGYPLSRASASVGDCAAVMHLMLLLTKAGIVLHQTLPDVPDLAELSIEECCRRIDIAVKMIVSDSKFSSGGSVVLMSREEQQDCYCDENVCSNSLFDWLFGTEESRKGKLTPGTADVHHRIHIRPKDFMRFARSIAETLNELDPYKEHLRMCKIQLPVSKNTVWALDPGSRKLTPKLN